MAQPSAAGQVRRMGKYLTAPPRFHDHEPVAG